MVQVKIVSFLIYLCPIRFYVFWEGDTMNAEDVLMVADVL